MDEEKLQDVADELAEAADQAKAAADATGEPATAPQTDAELREALKQADDRALRAQAELENFRKRMRRDMEEERRYAALPLVSDLLAVADNLQRAIESTDSTEETAGLIDGVKMVAAQLETVLTQHHCKPIEALGQPFDPNVHEALAQIPTNEQPPGTVVDVHQQGFMLHDRVVRPTQVLVSRAADEPAAEDQSG